MKSDQHVEKGYSSKEIVGKFIVLNKSQTKWLEGWVAIEKNLKEFSKTLREEIEYEWKYDKLIFENLKLFAVDMKDKTIIEIVDNMILNKIRRNDKVLIVLLDKSTGVKNVEDIELVNKWVVQNITHY